MAFFAFNDIQSDYYQIPLEDKETLKNLEEKIREDLKNTNIEEINNTNEKSNEREQNENSEKTIERTKKVKTKQNQIIEKN